MLYFLVGYMGSGKTSLAKRISKLTGIPYIDSDKAIEAKESKSISEIFSIHGEAYFRQCERAFLEALNSNENLIISTGGGLPCFNDNMKLIKSIGKSWYLQLSPEKLAERLSVSRIERPLLKDKSQDELKSFLETHLSERELHYLMADFVVDARKPFEDLALLISTSV